jgi:hypothetical protein
MEQGVKQQQQNFHHDAPPTLPKAPIPKFLAKMNCPTWTGACSPSIFLGRF